MYVNDVAVILEVSTWQVHKYIRDKHLKSELIDGIRHIENEDFEIFYKTYFLYRHTKKGKSIATNDEFETLKEFTADIQSDMSYDDFIKKYKHLDQIIPPLKKFKLLKRNKMIVGDNEHMKQRDIADKYDLSVRTIEEIIKKSKEGSN